MLTQRTKDIVKATAPVLAQHGPSSNAFILDSLKPTQSSRMCSTWRIRIRGSSSKRLLEPYTPMRRILKTRAASPLRAVHRSFNAAR